MIDKKDGFIQQTKPFFECDGCDEEFENQTCFVINDLVGEIILCRRCYKELLIETNQDE